MSRNIMNLSKRTWLMAAILVASLTGVASARNGGSGSGSSFAKAQRGMVGSLRAATRQYGEVGGSNNGQLRQRADGNMRQAIQSKVSMLKAQQRGLDAKREAAFTKAQVLEKAGDKVGAEAYLNKGISYEVRGRGISARINKLSDPGYQNELISRYGKMKTSATVRAQAAGVQNSGNTGVVGSAAMGRPDKAGKAASLTYNGARKAYVGYLANGRAAAQEYRKTGDPAALQQLRLSAVNRLRTRGLMYKAQVQGLRSKAAAAAAGGNPEQAAAYTAKADTLQTRAQRVSGAADRFESKLRAGTLKTPRRMAANQPADGAEVDGPEMDFGKTPAQQATDSEGAPGVDTKQQAVRGIASGKGKRNVKVQLHNGNILGALGTLKQMEAQANRRGPMGLVDRYRKWSAKRRVMKDAYSMGKKAARSGDLKLAQEALQAVTTLGKPGFRTNHKVRTIANKALTGAQHAARDRNPQEARTLLDFARPVVTMGRQKPTRRFLRIRKTARSNAWNDMKRQAKEGNLEAFRATRSLIRGFSKEDPDGKKLTRKEGREMARLYQTATKKSVGRALKNAKMVLSGKMGYVNVEEGAKQLAYAEKTAKRLGIEADLQKVRKMLVKGVQDQNRVEPGKPTLFTRWWRMGGGRGGPNITPVPRTPAEIAEGRRMERMQQEIIKMAESGDLTQEKLQQYPPELLQHMGLM